MAKQPQNPICIAMEAAFKKWYMDTFYYPWVSRSIAADRKNLNSIYQQLKQLSEMKGNPTDNDTMMTLFKRLLEGGKESGVWFMQDVKKFSLNLLNSNFNQVVGGIQARSARLSKTQEKKPKFDFDE